MMRYSRCLTSAYFILCVLGLLLGGCSKKTPSFSPGSDGPPRRIPKHIDKIPDATPKVEPLSRYGNRFKNSNVYVVGKKRYAVNSTSRGYSAHGTASWYGTKFQGRKTSSGEPYDMFSMTAAHRTLPLPTYARVTNLENGKSVVVKVNDRGPFHCNRLIDLSYVAAHKLGIVGHGTGKVKVESVDPRDHHGKIPKIKRFFQPQTESQPQAESQAKSQRVTHASALASTLNAPTSVPTAVPSAPSSTALTAPSLTSPQPPSIAKSTRKKKLYLQLGAFSQKNNAETFAKKVGDFSKLPTFITESMSNAGPRYRVRLGPFKNEAQMVTLKQALTLAKFPNPVVVNEQ